MLLWAEEAHMLGKILQLPFRDSTELVIPPPPPPNHTHARTHARTHISFDESWASAIISSAVLPNVEFHPLDTRRMQGIYAMTCGRHTCPPEAQNVPDDHAISTHIAEPCPLADWLKHHWIQDCAGHTAQALAEGAERWTLQKP